MPLLEMSERDYKALVDLRKDAEFFALERELYTLHARLLLNDVRAVYIPDSTTFFVLPHPKMDNEARKHFSSAFLREAERISRHMSKFFPISQRWMWQERFIGYAVYGDFRPIPSGARFIIPSYLDDEEDAVRYQKLTDKHRKSDTTADAIITMFLEGQNNEDSELAYLYDVWDRLKRRLGGDSEALSLLDVTSRRKRFLTRLSNVDPVRQGRHRGFHDPSDLREATEDELIKAREITAQMIYGYLLYLEGKEN